MQTTSFFAGIGKRTAWKTWDVFPDVTDVFSLLADASPSMIDSTYEVLEKYVDLLYDKTCQLTQVNEARQASLCTSFQSLGKYTYNTGSSETAYTTYRLPSRACLGTMTTKGSHINKSCKLGLALK